MSTWIFQYYSGLGILIIKTRLCFEMESDGRASYQLPSGQKGQGARQSFYPSSRRKLPQLQGFLTGQLYFDRLLRVALVPNQARLYWLPSGADPLGSLLTAAFPFFSLANRTLIWFGQQCTWIQRTGQDWPKPVMAPCSLLSVTGLWEGMGPCWSARYDGKSAGGRFSLVKGGMEKSLCSITSLALCFKHCHVMPVMEL